MELHIVLVLILLGTTLTGCSHREPNARLGEWTDFSDSQGKFSVAMPGVPEREEYDMPIASGTMKFTGNFVDLPEQAKFFMVSFVDYPPEIPHDDEASAHEVIDRYVAGGARKKKLAIRQKSKISLENHPGQEYLFDEPEHGDKSLWRVYLVGDRLYQLVANWDPKDAESSADAEKFLNSFKLTD